MMGRPTCSVACGAGNIARSRLYRRLLPAERSPSHLAPAESRRQPGLAAPLRRALSSPSRDRVVVGGDSAGDAGRAEVDRRECVVKFPRWVSAGQEVLDTHQPAL